MTFYFRSFEVVFHTIYGFKCSRSAVNLSKLRPNVYSVIINLGHISAVKNGYICSKQTDKIYYNHRH